MTESKDEKMKNVPLSSSVIKSMLIQLFKEFLTCQLAVAFMYFVTRETGVHIIVLSGISSLAFTLVLPSFAPFYLSTTFGCLMNKENFVKFYVIFIQGLVCFLLNVLARKFLVGVGGKLGFLGFLSTLISILVSYLISLDDSSDIYNVIQIIWNPQYYTMVNGGVIGLSVITSAIASVFLTFISKSQHIKNHPAPKLVSYGINASIFGLLLIIWKSYFGEVITVANTRITFTYGSYLINFWHTGLFAAMTVKARLSPLIKSEYINYMILGFGGGMFNIALSGIIVVGGKHGLSALFSNLLYLLFTRLLIKYKMRNQGFKKVKTKKRHQRSKNMAIA